MEKNVKSGSQVIIRLALDSTIENLTRTKPFMAEYVTQLQQLSYTNTFILETSSGKDQEGHTPHLQPGRQNIAHANNVQPR